MADHCCCSDLLVACHGAACLFENVQASTTCLQGGLGVTWWKMHPMGVAVSGPQAAAGQEQAQQVNAPVIQPSTLQLWNNHAASAWRQSCSLAWRQSLTFNAAPACGRSNLSCQAYMVKMPGMSLRLLLLDPSSGHGSRVALIRAEQQYAASQSPVAHSATWEKTCWEAHASEKDGLDASQCSVSASSTACSFLAAISLSLLGHQHPWCQLIASYSSMKAHKAACARSLPYAAYCRFEDAPFISNPHNAGRVFYALKISGHDDDVDTERGVCCLQRPMELAGPCIL